MRQYRDRKRPGRRIGLDQQAKLDEVDRLAPCATPDPTPALQGTAARIAAYRARVERNLPIWHAGDGRES